MKIKILSFGMSMLFVLVAFPMIPASNGFDSVETPLDSSIDTFTGCYIEVTGDIALIDWPRVIGSNMWKLSWFRPFGTDFAVVSYWRLVLDESTTISVYTEKNGDLLWQHDGTGYPQLRIFGFLGTYIPTGPYKETLHVELNGSVGVLLKNIK